MCAFSPFAPKPPDVKLKMELQQRDNRDAMPSLVLQNTVRARAALRCAEPLDRTAVRI